MSEREETTAMLSKMVQRRCESRHRFSAPEVMLEDPKTGNAVRVDFMGFDPYMCGSPYPNPSSVGLGKFTAYEVKSCWADLTSGHGLNILGDQNFLVTTNEVADRLTNGEMASLRRRLDEVLVPIGGRLCVARRCKCFAHSERYRYSNDELLLAIFMAQTHHAPIKINEIKKAES
ncbi:hypothetical protein OZX67_03925 [Bifidobacterium sp. ESL0728]|uniref:hypothetical protein n=1 Tax=Bifidobacterium sp. ESL0728 TaxID=2983220 RepID=UPI0023F714B0|nr:hypothetical protein [Bifidobacterium sp. ESL0728]WEV59696.1 hypothetical protein OZX67_03925 [Bifidobacterium sp. ESL0728]